MVLREMRRQQGGDICAIEPRHDLDLDLERSGVRPVATNAGACQIAGGAAEAGRFSRALCGAEPRDHGVVPRTGLGRRVEHLAKLWIHDVNPTAFGRSRDEGAASGSAEHAGRLTRALSHASP